MGSAEDQLAYLQATLGEDWPSLRYGLVASGTLRLSDVLELEDDKVSSISHIDRLRELLGNDSRLVASNLPWDSMDFKVILAGLLSEYGEAIALTTRPLGIGDLVVKTAGKENLRLFLKTDMNHRDVLMAKRILSRISCTWDI